MARLNARRGAQPAFRPQPLDSGAKIHKSPGVAKRPGQPTCPAKSSREAGAGGRQTQRQRSRYLRSIAHQRQSASAGACQGRPAVLAKAGRQSNQFASRRGTGTRATLVLHRRPARALLKQRPAVRPLALVELQAAQRPLHRHLRRGWPAQPAAGSRQHKSPERTRRACAARSFASPQQSRGSPSHLSCGAGWWPPPRAWQRPLILTPSPEPRAQSPSHC